MGGTPVDRSLAGGLEEEPSGEIHGCSDEAAESVDVSGEDSNPASVWADDRPGRFERAAGGAEAGRCGA